MTQKRETRTEELNPVSLSINYRTAGSVRFVEWAKTSSKSYSSVVLPVSGVYILLAKEHSGYYGRYVLPAQFFHEVWRVTNKYGGRATEKNLGVPMTYVV